MMSGSKYAQRMARLSARIFGEVSRETDVKSTKVLRIFSGKPPHMDPYYNKDYYPRHVELTQLMDGLREHGLFRYVGSTYTLFILKEHQSSPNRIIA